MSHHIEIRRKPVDSCCPLFCDENTNVINVGNVQPGLLECSSCTADSESSNINPSNSAHI
jgi:hypothetical protein